MCPESGVHKHGFLKTLKQRFWTPLFFTMAPTQPHPSVNRGDQQACGRRSHEKEADCAGQVWCFSSGWCWRVSSGMLAKSCMNFWVALASITLSLLRSSFWSAVPSSERVPCSGAMKISAKQFQLALRRMLYLELPLETRTG